MKDSLSAQTGLIVTTWNLEWAPPRSARGQEMRDRLAATQADVICLTEAFAENLPAGGHIIEADPDYGYRLHLGRRKVILWTRHAWEEPDSVGSPLLPPGRFAAGKLVLSNSSVRVVGVCVPWATAHVSSGRRDRSRWEDHLSYLEGLGRYLGDSETTPTILLGDFNQAIPRRKQRLDVAQCLQNEVLDRGYSPLSAGLSADDGWPLIDHICVSETLTGRVLEQLPKQSPTRRLSDHAGLLAQVSEREDHGLTVDTRNPTPAEKRSA